MPVIVSRSQTVVRAKMDDSTYAKYRFEATFADCLDFDGASNASSTTQYTAQGRHMSRISAIEVLSTTRQKLFPLNLVLAFTDRSSRD